ncbi:MAG: hypothetical protein MK008_09780 [Bdellovibrionales bacterium]|nr:hypothetical protein [Bdellovibrionales bacterium]
MFICIVFFLYSMNTYAMFEMVNEMAESLATAEAMTELMAELGKDKNDINKMNNDISVYQNMLNKLNSDLLKMKQVKRDANSLTNLPDININRLNESIKFTTRYIRKLKRLMTMLSGTPAAASAVGQAQTNMALNESVKNQQELIYLMTELSALEKIKHKDEDLRRQQILSLEQERINLQTQGFKLNDRNI